MQQRPAKDKGLPSLRAKGTQPALPGATMPTVPVGAPPQQYPVRPHDPPAKKRPNAGQLAVLRLLGLGAGLELLFLAFYPLLAGSAPRGDAVKQALLGLFPWTFHLYWTQAFPALLSWLAHTPLFNPATGGGNINLLLLLFAVSFALVLIAARIGSRVLRVRLSRGYIRALFCTIILITLVFGITYLFAPAVLSLSQDMFLYGLYGRLVTVYHVNPFAVSLTVFPHDPLSQGIAGGAPGARVPGPLWIDLCIPVALLARASVANILVGFRLVGLIAHLINAMLVWTILARLKPETRISATILYAWNPLVLLLSISSMHLDVVLVLFILLATLFFQRKSLILAWVLVLLAVLINIVFLPLLPLFIRLLAKETRPMPTGRRALWWLAAVVVFCLVMLLAYAPYWQSWGMSGLLTSLRQAFWQDSAINSLDSALLNLSIKLPPVFSWLITPHHWIIFAIVTVGCLLVLGLWLADTLRFVVLFSSWILLAMLVLLPTYWPWYLILPLALALCSADGRSILLALLLTLGALGSYCFWLWQPTWASQALVTVGLPLLIWGWVLFFSSTWAMTHANEPELAVNPPKRRGLSRPSFPSRPSWPGRRR